MELEGSTSVLGEQNPYVAQAFDVVTFRLIQSKSDLEREESSSETENSFSPEFVHQHFGENESVFGYKSPKIELLYSALDLNLCIRFSHKGSITDQHPEMKPDDVMKLLSEHLPFHFETNVDTFSKSVEEARNTFKPTGELIHSYTTNTNKGTTEFTKYAKPKRVPKESQSARTAARTFCVYKVNSANVNEKFVELYQRMESFALWFVDAASYTDTDDERWHYYILYEKCKEASGELYFFAGYASVYDYYAYPQHLRPRIGHILILPPFRRSGHGSHMLQAIYNDLVPDPKVLDITAEDPSDNFIHLRDFVDCINCSKLTTFQPDLLKAGFSKQMQEEARNQLKIGKKQIRRVYEILRLKHTDCKNPEELKEYRLDVKKRLNAPFQKNKVDWNKLVKVLNPEELAATATSMLPEQRIPQLEKMYQDTVEDYRYTLNRLATYCK